MLVGKAAKGEAHKLSQSDLMVCVCVLSTKTEVICLFSGTGVALPEAQETSCFWNITLVYFLAFPLLAFACVMRSSCNS